MIERRLGLEFADRREDDLERRLARALHAVGASEPAHYLSRLSKLPGGSAEWERFVGHLTVGETYFFRDASSFAALEQEVLPPLIERRRRDGTRRLRIWSAGCSSGEEPYSIAMTLDRLIPDRSDWWITVLGSDVNPHSLAAARRGLYREWSFRSTPEWIRRRYFRRCGPGTFELAAPIRDMVKFAPLNLAEEVYPASAPNTSAMDVILCRNVIMYFTDDAQRATVARLRAALLDGGWLAVSPAEASVDLLRSLEPVQFPGTVFFRKRLQRDEAPVGQARMVAARRVPPPGPQKPTQPPTMHRRPSPATMTSALERARSEADNGNLDLAAELCHEAVRSGQLDPETHLLLAAIEQERGNLAAAVEAIRRVIYLTPDSPWAHFVLGSLLFRRGETERARASIEAAVGLLGSLPPDQVVDGADGLPAGRLLETALASLEVR